MIQAHITVSTENRGLRRLMVKASIWTHEPGRMPQESMTFTFDTKNRHNELDELLNAVAQLERLLGDRAAAQDQLQLF